MWFIEPTMNDFDLTLKKKQHEQEFLKKKIKKSLICQYLHLRFKLKLLKNPNILKGLASGETLKR